MKKSSFKSIIYKISTIDDNGVVEEYIGKTSHSYSENRLREHKNDAFKYNDKSERKLHQALREAAVVYIEDIEVVEEKDASTRERFNIRKHDTFKNGLNSSEGGEGSDRVNEVFVVEFNEDNKVVDFQEVVNIRHAVQVLLDNVMFYQNGPSSELDIDMNIRRALRQERPGKFTGKNKNFFKVMTRRDFEDLTK